MRRKSRISSPAGAKGRMLGQTCCMKMFFLGLLAVKAPRWFQILEGKVFLFAIHMLTFVSSSCASSRLCIITLGFEPIHIIHVPPNRFTIRGTSTGRFFSTLEK